MILLIPRYSTIFHDIPWYSMIIYDNPCICMHIPCIRGYGRYRGCGQYGSLPQSRQSRQRIGKCSPATWHCIRHAFVSWHISRPSGFRVPFWARGDTPQTRKLMPAASHGMRHTYSTLILIPRYSKLFHDLLWYSTIIHNNVNSPLFHDILRYDVIFHDIPR